MKMIMFENLSINEFEFSFWKNIKITIIEKYTWETNVFNQIVDDIIGDKSKTSEIILLSKLFLKKSEFE